MEHVKVHTCFWLPGEHVTTGLAECIIFWLCLDYGWVFSRFFLYHCSCLMASGIGVELTFEENKNALDKSCFVLQVPPPKLWAMIHPRQKLLSMVCEVPAVSCKFAGRMSLQVCAGHPHLWSFFYFFRVLAWLINVGLHTWGLKKHKITPTVLFWDVLFCFVPFLWFCDSLVQTSPLCFMILCSFFVPHPTHKSDTDLFFSLVKKTDMREFHSKLFDRKSKLGRDHREIVVHCLAHCKFKALFVVTSSFCVRTVPHLYISRFFVWSHQFTTVCFAFCFWINVHISNMNAQTSHQQLRYFCNDFYRQCGGCFPPVGTTDHGMPCMPKSDGTQVGIFKKTNKVSLTSLLQAMTAELWKRRSATWTAQKRKLNVRIHPHHAHFPPPPGRCLQTHEHWTQKMHVSVFSWLSHFHGQEIMQRLSSCLHQVRWATWPKPRNFFALSKMMLIQRKFAWIMPKQSERIDQAKCPWWCQCVPSKNCSNSLVWEKRERTARDCLFALSKWNIIFFFWAVFLLAFCVPEGRNCSTFSCKGPLSQHPVSIVRLLEFGQLSFHKKSTGFSNCTSWCYFVLVSVLCCVWGWRGLACPGRVRRLTATMHQLREGKPSALSSFKPHAQETHLGPSSGSKWKNLFAF